MDCAFGRDRNLRESADQSLADFSSTPAGVLALQVQNVILYLKRKLIGVAIGTAASVGESLNTAFLITIEDLVAGLTGNPKLSAKVRHRLAGQLASHKLHPLVHDRTLLPRHFSLPIMGGSVTHVSGTMCYPCLRPLIFEHQALLPIHLRTDRVAFDRLSWSGQIPSMLICSFL